MVVFRDQVHPHSGLRAGRKRPVSGGDLLFAQLRQSQGIGLGLGNGWLLPSGPFFDPGAQGSNVRITQLVRLLGHQVRIVRIERDQLDHSALVRLAWDNGNEILIPFKQPLAHVEANIALLLLRAVALNAVGFKDRIDVLEEVHVDGSGGG